MKVFVTGGTGFVGKEIVGELRRAGHEVRLLVRPHSPSARLLPAGVEPAWADVLDSDLEKQLEGVEAVLHLVGIIRAFPSRGITFSRLHLEATRNVLRAMKSAGVRRLVHMSALGAGPEGATEYFRTKWAAETEVKDSDREWTVMKPSVIFGPEDRFINLLLVQVREWPVAPVIGDGGYRLQPVSVMNVAQGFVRALSLPETIGRVYEIGGPEQFTYDQLLDELARGLGKKKARKVHLPLGLIKPAVRLLEGLSFFPLTSDQLTMLLLSNICDHRPFFSAFQLQPITLREGLREYLRK